MGKSNPEAVGKALKKVAQGKEAEELYFDPQSGVLEVIKADEVVNDPDRVPATKMAREGFFSRTEGKDGTGGNSTYNTTES